MCSSASDAAADASARRPSPTRARVVHLSIDVPSYRTTRAVTVDARRVARRSSTRRVLALARPLPLTGRAPSTSALDHLGGSNAPSTVTLNDSSMRLCGWVPSYRPGPGASDVRVAISPTEVQGSTDPSESLARWPTQSERPPRDAFDPSRPGARRGGFGSKRGSSLNTPPAPRRCDAARYTSGAGPYAPPGPGVEDIESRPGSGSGSRGIPRANPPPARAGTEDFGTTSDDGYLPRRRAHARRYSKSRAGGAEVRRAFRGQPRVGRPDRTDPVPANLDRPPRTSARR